MHSQGRAQAPLLFLLRWAASPISLVACLTGVVLEYQGQKMDIGRVDSVISNELDAWSWTFPLPSMAHRALETPHLSSGRNICL